MFKTILALALFGAASAGTAVSVDLGEWAMREHFAAFEGKFSKTYSTVADRESKFRTFVQNMEEVVAKNAELLANGEDAVFGITKFSDISPEEFIATMLNDQMPAAASGNVTVATPAKTATATAFDWRDVNVVTAVRNQGKDECGDSWAVTAVEAVESQYALAGGALTEFSVQQVVSCDPNNKGCHGGWYYRVWDEYLNIVGGLTTEAAYPYAEATFQGNPPECQSDLSMVDGTIPSSYEWATVTCTSAKCDHVDEGPLKDNLVSYGPITVSIDARLFNYYKGGVFTESSCTNNANKISLCAQLVGYNTDAATPYWILKNSWGTDWGVDGYFYLKMGENTCGIANRPAMVLMA